VAATGGNWKRVVDTSSLAPGDLLLIPEARHHYAGLNHNIPAKASVAIFANEVQAQPPAVQPEATQVPIAAPRPLKTPKKSVIA